MDVIYESAAKFVVLEDYKYRFIVSSKRKSRELILDFCDSDFWHLAGLHYLTDISIPKNRRDTLKNIIEKKQITDALLNKSRFYKNAKSDKDIRSRIEELRFLEEYLDTDNMIRIYNTQNDKYLQSFIREDYLIESQLGRGTDSVYIFLKERNESPGHYGAVSFFKKASVTYGGDKLYWMLKEKTGKNGIITLYRHPNYKKN